MTRAALYLRQSLDPRKLGEGIERQRERCTMLAESRGWEIAAQYEDNDVSATKQRGEKTGWHRLLSDARAGRIDTVVAVDMDRLLRTVGDLVTLVETGVKVTTVDGEIDLSTADGEFRATMLAGIARFEGRRKAERQRRANEQRRERGAPTSGRVPYGYEWIPTAERTRRGSDDAYEIVPAQAAVIQSAYRSFLAGIPLGSICRELNDAGESTKLGSVWRPTNLRRVLLSPYYAALLPRPRSDGKPYDQRAITRADCVPGAWPAIVTEAEWLAARAVLLQTGRSTSPGPARKWLLSGLALCETCGRKIVEGGGKAGIHSYRCPSMSHFMRRGVPLDEFVEAVVVARLSRPDAAELLIDRERPDLDALRDERVAVDGRLRSIGELILDGTMTAEEARGALSRGRERLAEIDAQTTDAGRGEVLADVVGAVDVETAWTGLPLGRKRAVIDALMTIKLRSVGQGNYRRMSFEAMSKTVDIEWRA